LQDPLFERWSKTNMDTGCWKALEEMEEMEEFNFKNTPSPAFRDLSPSGSAIQNSPV
jgi:hypothetical protein